MSLPVDRRPLLRLLRRTFLGSITVAAGAGVLAACTGRPQPAASRTGAFPARINGKLAVIQNKDFHPDHNDFVNKKIAEVAQAEGWPLDLAYVDGYVGAGNIVQKLHAAVQAGTPPDVMTHTLRPLQLDFLNILQPVSDVVADLTRKYGEPIPGFKTNNFLKGRWTAVPFFTRAGGYYARRDVFQRHGIDPNRELDTYEKVRMACLAVSDPDAGMWGWGMTVNRCGDGESLVSNVVFMWGGQLVDESGEKVVLNSRETIEALTWLKEIYTDKKWERMLPPGVNSWTDPSNNEAYLAGQIALTQNAGTLYAKALFDKNPVGQHTVYLPNPAGPKRRLQGAYGANWYVFNGAKNADAARELIKRLLSEPVQEFIFQTSVGYAMPAYQWGWDRPIIKNDPVASRYVETAWDQSGFTGVFWPGPPTPAANAIDTSNFWTDLMGDILNGTRVDEAVRAAHERAVKVYREFGFRGA